MARKFYVLIAIVAWVAGGSVQLGCAKNGRRSWKRPRKKAKFR